MSHVRRLSVVAVIAIALAYVGCAKRPATLGSAAPAPSGTSAAAPTAPAPAAVAPAPTEPPRAAEAPPAAPPSPTTGRPAPAEFSGHAALRDVYFEFDKSDIRQADFAILDANAAWLAANRDHLVLIEGHCDERGTNEYNLALGERRARATRTYLVSKGIAADRINIISYGEERPACTEKTEACWAKNRRAHFLVKAQ